MKTCTHSVKYTHARPECTISHLIVVTHFHMFRCTVLHRDDDPLGLLKNELRDVCEWRLSCSIVSYSSSHDISFLGVFLR